MIESMEKAGNSVIFVLIYFLKYIRKRELKQYIPRLNLWNLFKLSRSVLIKLNFFTLGKNLLGKL